MTTTRLTRQPIEIPITDLTAEERSRLTPTDDLELIKKEKEAKERK